MRIVGPTLVVLLLAVVGGGAFFAARAITGQEGVPPPWLAEYEKALEEDALRPRFAGAVQGIFIAPEGIPVPDQYLGVKCAGPTVAAPWEQAGQLALSVELPRKFVFQPDDLNTGVVACDGRVYATRWTYHFTGIDGTLGNLGIARGESFFQPYDVSVDHVKVITVGGRPAVLLEPVVSDVGNTSALIIFPESFGTTIITGYNLSMADLMSIAEIVSEATN